MEKEVDDRGSILRGNRVGSRIQTTDSECGVGWIYIGFLQEILETQILFLSHRGLMWWMGPHPHLHPFLRF